MAKSEVQRSYMGYLELTFASGSPRTCTYANSNRSAHMRGFFASTLLRIGLRNLQPNERTKGPSAVDVRLWLTLICTSVNSDRCVNMRRRPNGHAEEGVGEYEIGRWYIIVQSSSDSPGSFVAHPHNLKHENILDNPGLQRTMSGHDFKNAFGPLLRPETLICRM